MEISYHLPFYLITIKELDTECLVINTNQVFIQWSLGSSSCYWNTLLGTSFFFFDFLNFILFIFLYSRFLLVIHFIHISVYMLLGTSWNSPFQLQTATQVSNFFLSLNQNIFSWNFYLSVLCLPLVTFRVNSFPLSHLLFENIK